MPPQPPASVRGTSEPVIPHSEPAGGVAMIDAASGVGGRLPRWLKVVGPGLIAGASDADPSGIGTHAVVGASLGFATLWTSLVTLPLMAAVQFICAKIGMVSGRGMAGVLRRHYPPAVLVPVVVSLVVANSIGAGADIGAVAAGINLLAPVSARLLIVPVALGVLALQVWGSYRLIATIFKWLTLTLVAYIAAAILAKPGLGAVARATFVPHLALDSAYLTALVAIIGTRISPYLFFWQSNQVVEEEVSAGRRRLWQRRGATDAELHYAAVDTNIGMGFANVVFYFIILSTAATLHRTGVTSIGSAAEAAAALEPVAGSAARLLFAVGLIGAGVLGIPVLTGSAAYAVAEGFGWRYGLDETPGRAREFYGVIAASTLAGLALNFIGINPITALLYAGVINGLVAPPVLVLIMLIANNRMIMGDRVNNRVTNLAGWLTVALTTAACCGLALTWIVR